MKKESTLEALLLKAALEARGVTDVEAEFSDGHKHVDLRIPSAHMDIEVDGPQHLRSSTQMLKDLGRSHYSDKDGYGTIHIHNAEVVTDLSRISKAIAQAVFIRQKLFAALSKKKKSAW